MWRRKKNKNVDAPDSTVRDKAAVGIGMFINNMHKRFGSTLNRKTAALSQRGKIVFLIVFCLSFGGGSLYIMFDGWNSAASTNLLKLKSISVPKHIDKTGAPNVRVLITARDIQKIQSFRRYMDSLKTTNQGLVIHDSILHARPGLMDSLTEVERLYGLDSAGVK